MTLPTTPPVPTTIAGLPAAGSITGSEYVAVSQGGVTVRTTANQLGSVGPTGPSGAINATSTTSNTIGTGALTFTTQTGLAIVAGQFLLISNTGTASNYVHGQVTSYNTSSGSLVMNITDVGGSGTFSAWTIALSGPQGTAGGGVTATGSPSNGNLTKFSGSGSITNADLSGDVTTSGGVATTLATVNSNVGAFASATFNAKGLATAAANLSGDITTSGAVSTLATVNSNVGAFTAGTFTVNAKGLITAASANTLSGNTTTLATTTGSLTSGHAAIFDASGNIKDGGALNMTVIQTQTASAAASVDFTSGITSTYSLYLLVGNGIFSSSGTDTLRSRLQQSSAFVSSANYSVAGVTYPNTTLNTSGQTSMALTGGNMGALAGLNGSLILWMFAPSNSAINTSIIFQTMSGNVFGGSTGSGRLGLTAVTTGIQVYMGTGNISGTFTLYGIA